MDGVQGKPNTRNRSKNRKTSETYDDDDDGTARYAAEELGSHAKET